MRRGGGQAGRGAILRVFLLLAAGAGWIGAADGRPAGPDPAPSSGAPASAEPGEGWLHARPDYAWSFPRDHWAHRGYRTEWWYFTGNLASPEGRRFGYQFTLFRIGLLRTKPALDSEWATADLVMGHAAVTDLASGRHVFSELLYRETPLLGGFDRPPEAGSQAASDRFPGDRSAGSPGSGLASDRIAWSRAPVGTDTTWTLAWNGSGFDFRMEDAAAGIAFTLRTSPEKPLVLEGPNGYSRKGRDAAVASEYYSFTRLRTEGRLTVGGTESPVRGESWMDKEFGSGQLAPNQVGWDWFSLQLDGGREVMLYLLRDRSGAVDFARGTLVEPGGSAIYLEPADWTVRTLATWKSPQTGAEYPARWSLVLHVPQGSIQRDAESGELRCTVIPELPDQENRGRLAGGLFYWEGMVRIESEQGAPVGRGYVELTGYGTNNRPAL